MKTLLRDIKVTFPYINIFIKRRKARNSKIKAMKEVVANLATAIIKTVIENKILSPYCVHIYYKLADNRLKTIRCQPLPNKHCRKLNGGVIPLNTGGNNFVIKNTPTIGEDGIIHIKIDEHDESS